MRFFRRIAGILGFAKDDSHDLKNEDEDVDSDNQPSNRVHMQETGLPRRGFSVPVQVAVNRPQPGPILVPSSSGDGGVQGLKWYANRLRVDEDGDVAEQFLDEVLPEMPTSTTDHPKSFPRFQVNSRNRPAKVENQVILQEGKLQQCIKHQGRLQWV
ncbi:uncharacterized protein LOC111022940 [Momordica charantia]|uniref:Uncharacterized protein LOC111022940 n=1 Tax=Momordica charantia TaxID=3673 RepID=A0A6J1DQR1_MOMCH|nr:uncharacterized protein LOC111022940 [Momordica charantia]